MYKLRKTDIFVQKQYFPQMQIIALRLQLHLGYTPLSIHLCVCVCVCVCVMVMNGKLRLK